MINGRTNKFDLRVTTVEWVKIKIYIFQNVKIRFSNQIKNKLFEYEMAEKFD